VADPVPLDSTWLREHPLPTPDPQADKNARGRVLMIGGCRTVPGGIQLTAEAALRAGAGKVQVATVESAALALGMAMPEIAVFALTEDGDGEIAGLGEAVPGLLPRCDAVLLGPASADAKAAGRILDAVLDETACTAPLVLDAAVLMDLGPRASRLRGCGRPVVLTPHIGEMAAMLECEAEAIDGDRTAHVVRAAERFGATVVLKGSTSLIAGPDGALLAFAGGGVGLATGGSGDVMAGIAAGLLARGADAPTAAAWATWLHGEAGRRCAEQIGPLGFLARELLAQVPSLMRAVC